jgi:hypothetical protein
VVDRFALTRAAELQEAEYVTAMRQRPAAAPAELIRSGTGVVASKLRTKYQRWRGAVATDDANARPIVAAHGKA